MVNIGKQKFALSTRIHFKGSVCTQLNSHQFFIVLKEVSHRQTFNGTIIFFPCQLTSVVLIAERGPYL